MSKAVIAGYVRSPFHFAGKGAPDQGQARRPVGGRDQGAAREKRREAGRIEDLILGCAFPEGEQGPTSRASSP